MGLLDFVPYSDETERERVDRALERPEPGKHWLDHKAVEAERKTHERKEMDKARRRDMAACHGCRWPACEFMPKKPRLEVAHVFEHRGMGGNPDGERTLQHLLILACFIHHKRIDNGDLEVHETTDQGTDGPLSFHAKNPETGVMEHVATERIIGVSEART